MLGGVCRWGRGSFVEADAREAGPHSRVLAVNGAEGAGRSGRGVSLKFPKVDRSDSLF